MKLTELTWPSMLKNTVESAQYVKSRNSPCHNVFIIEHSNWTTLADDRY